MQRHDQYMLTLPWMSNDQTYKALPTEAPELCEDYITDQLIIPGMIRMLSEPKTIFPRPRNTL